MAADKTEKSSKVAGRQVARPDTPEHDSEDAIVLVPGTPPLACESQGGTTIALAIRTPERLQGPPELIPALAFEPQGTPEGQVEPPASTAPARVEDGLRKRTLGRVPIQITIRLHHHSPKLTVGAI